MIVVRLLAAGILFILAVALSVLFVAISATLAIDIYRGGGPIATSLPLPIIPSTPTVAPNSPTPIVATPTRSAQCDPSYPTLCLLPSTVKNLRCADIPSVNFPVLPPDPQRFDQDGDGVGCEDN